MNNITFNNKNNQIQEYHNEIIKLKADNLGLIKQCNEFNERIMMLHQENAEYEAMRNGKNTIIEKQNKVIETFTTQNSIQISNVHSNEKLAEQAI